MQCFGGAERSNRIAKSVLIPMIIILAYYISENWYQVSLIQGDSMQPSYHNMQFIVLDKRNREYSYGDVIAFQCENLDAVLVKRIVACPGDWVIIENGILYVNDKVSSVFTQEYTFAYDGVAQEYVILEEGQYFVIGDNLRKSKDSRYAEVGCVYDDDILGRVIPYRPVK